MHFLGKIGTIKDCSSCLTGPVHLLFLDWSKYNTYCYKWTNLPQLLYWTGPIITKWTLGTLLLGMDQSSITSWTTGPNITDVCYKWTGPL